MNVSLTGEGLLDPRVFDAWTREKQQQVRAGIVAGMKEVKGPLVSAVRAQAASAFNVKRKSWLSSFSAKVYDRRTDILPTLHVYSRMAWMGIHERGGTVNGPVLIPMNVGRMGAKQFKALVRRLLATGNAFFKKVNGKVLLFAENIGENSRELSRFKRAERARQGVKRLAKGTEIPIAVLLPRVTLKKRLRLRETVIAKLPTLARAIEKGIANNG